jgi:hypothetical protein
MKVQLNRINNTESPRVFKVEILVGTQTLMFDVKIEVDTIVNQTILITNGSQEFSEFFRFNQDLASNICKLVCSFYQSDAVTLPVYVGEFSPLRQLETMSK